MISVIIKGDPAAANAAAKARGIELHFRSQTIDPWTVGFVADSCYPLLLKWFCEPPLLGPFPEGTLLHYSEQATVFKPKIREC